MAKRFGALRSEMSPAAQARAAQRMLAEMPPQALEIYNRNRIREFDESEAELELMRRAAQAMLERGGEETLEARDIDRALADMLGAGGRFGARMLGAEPPIGFADVA